MSVDMYVKGKTSLERSARVAGVSVWRFLDELTKRKIGMRYKLEDAQEEIERIVLRHVKA
jgi:predicted HTH domain antitoxin